MHTQEIREEIEFILSIKLHAKLDNELCKDLDCTMFKDLDWNATDAILAEALFKYL